MGLEGEVLAVNEEYEIRLQDIGAAQPLAVIKAEAHARNIAERIENLLPTVGRRLSELAVQGTGRPIVVYFDEADRDFFGPPGIRIEVGFEVGAAFEDPSNAVLGSSLPAGRVASTVHVGPYQELVNAHYAIRKWCAERRLRITGQNWERYGEHHEDPRALRTAVFYALESE